MTTPSETSRDQPPLASTTEVGLEATAAAEPRRRFRMRPTAIQVLVSILITALGVVSSRALAIVDQDLRSMYTEYTLAATNLAHTSSDLLRYRVTLTRAIEATTQKEFDRIVASLPNQRSHVLQAVDRYAEASRRVLQRGTRAEQDLQGFRRSLDTYFLAADQTLALLQRLWKTSNPIEASSLRRQSELHAAENAGPKLVEASDALERLLLGVADLGKQMRDEGSGAIRTASLALVLGSLLIAALNILKP